MFNSNVNLKVDLCECLESQTRCATRLRYAPITVTITVHIDNLKALS